MAASAKRIYWDACVWISLILNEKILKDGVLIEDRGTLCRSVISQAKKGNVEIATSSFSLAEVCKNTGIKDSSSEDILASYFDTDYILMVNLDRQVGLRARRLMLSGHPGLKPADATHIATAVISNADEMNTFDDKMLKLNGKIARLDGTMLRICKPSKGGPPLPLLAEVENG